MKTRKFPLVATLAFLISGQSVAFAGPSCEMSNCEAVQSEACMSKCEQQRAKCNMEACPEHCSSASERTAYPRGGRGSF
jgi:hypothetical protein